MRCFWTIPVFFYHDNIIQRLGRMSRLPKVEGILVLPRFKRNSPGATDMMGLSFSSICSDLDHQELFFDHSPNQRHFAIQGTNSIGIARRSTIV